MTDKFNKFRIMLSASVPDIKRDKRYYTAHLPQEETQTTYLGEYGARTIDKIPNAQLHIEEAVICLARAVFAKSGQLIFGGHPSISPLISVISEEYIDEDENKGDRAQGLEKMEGDEYHYSPDENCPPVIIYQSRKYWDRIPHETRQMLAQGHAFIRWTAAEEHDDVMDAAGKTTHPLSLAIMRKEMIKENPLDAMVCIGGMEGIEREVDIFIEQYGKTKPIFLFVTSGGASALLAKDEARKSKGQIVIVDNSEGQDKKDEFGLLSSANYLAAANEIVKRVLGDNNETE